MATEIERKFLVRGTGWRTNTGIRIIQGYLNRDSKRTVRVRLAGARSFISIKSTTIGATRAEFEYEIPACDVEHLLKFCGGPLIEKVRYTVTYNGTTWEIDEFHGANAGLIIAEVELESEKQTFKRPPWLGADVTEDPRYFNSNLVACPYSSWREQQEI